jgi:phage major head subunit gpT-like protein
MIINGAVLDSLRVGFQTTFQNAFSTVDPVWDPFVQRMTTTNDVESFTWMEGVPEVTQWVDDAQFRTFSAQAWQVGHKKWQAGIVVSREDVVDDKLGQILPRINDLANQVRKHPGKLVYNKINTGDVTVCFDGEYFFDDDHPGGQSNIMTGPLTAANVNAMRRLFAGRRDRFGGLVDSTMTHLAVPPSLEMTAREILQPATLANGATNLNQGMVQLLVLPELEYGPNGSAVKWYGFDLSRGIKPFVYVEREGVTVETQTTPESENVFLRQIFRFNAWYRGNVDYLFWQLAAMSTGV